MVLLTTPCTPRWVLLEHEMAEVDSPLVMDRNFTRLLLASPLRAPARANTDTLYRSLLMLTNAPNVDPPYCLRYDSTRRILIFTDLYELTVDLILSRVRMILGN